MPASAIHGTAQDRFEPVRDAMAANIDSGADIGASFTATIEGETVVDLWGGWADAEKTRPWEADTIVNVYSTTKTMTALTALLVADRGELGFNAPVARDWPELSQAGTADTEVSALVCPS